MKSLSTRHLFVFFLALVCISSCARVDLYEKNVNIPRQNWKSDFKPEFRFTITDSTSSYRLFFIIRHTARYNFNNIWINLYSQPPGDSLRKLPYEIGLATDKDGWLGTGMDDIYEQRHPLTASTPFKAGDYVFSLEQIMRQDPLEHVLSVGLRVEKSE